MKLFNTIQLSFFISVLLYTGCASHDVPQEVDDSDLVEKFDLKDKRFDKFLTQPKIVEVPPKKAEKKEVKSVIA